ncbi:MAG: oligosaccharide flippase family protein [Actinomycetota bacterium]|nr:oligosaccharide flippase family protein [Actinomycetota bacterium]
MKFDDHSPDVIVEGPTLVARVRRQAGQLGREYGTVIFGVGLTRLITFVVTALLARSLSVADFGAYSIAYTVTILLAQLPNMLDASFIRHFAMADDDVDRKSYVRAHLYIKAVTDGAMIFLGLVAFRFLAGVVFHKSGLAPLLLAAIAAGACFSLMNGALSFFQARKKFLWYSGAFFAVNLAGLIAVVIYLAGFRATPLGAMLLFNTVIYAIAAAFAAVWLFRTSRVRNSVRRHARALIHFSGWLVPASVLYILLQRIDVLLLAHYATSRVVGLYGGAVMISSVVSLLTSNLQVVFLPKAAEAARPGGNLRSYTAQAALASGGILVLVIVGIAIAPILLRAALGVDYEQATGPLRLILVSYAFIALAPPCTALLYAAGKTFLLFIERLIETVVALTASLILIPRFSATGAAAAVVIGYSVGSAFVVFRAVTLVRRATSIGEGLA